MKHLFILAIVAISALMIAIEDNRSVGRSEDALVTEYEWDVLPGVSIRHDTLVSSILISQGWHTASACPKNHVQNLCSLDLSQLDGQPVHAVFRASRKSLDLMVEFRRKHNNANLCRTITARVMDLSGNTVATVDYLHVLENTSSDGIVHGTTKKISELTLPTSESGKIGTVAVPHPDNSHIVKKIMNPRTRDEYLARQNLYRSKPSGQWDGIRCPNGGPHLHQMPAPSS